MKSICFVVKRKWEENNQLEEKFYIGKFVHFVGGGYTIFKKEEDKGSLFRKFIGGANLSM